MMIILSLFEAMSYYKDNILLVIV